MRRRRTVRKVRIRTALARTACISGHEVAVPNAIHPGRLNVTIWTAHKLPAHMEAITMLRPVYFLSASCCSATDNFIVWPWMAAR